MTNRAEENALGEGKSKLVPFTKRRKMTDVRVTKVKGQACLRDGGINRGKNGYKGNIFCNSHK